MNSFEEGRAVRVYNVIPVLDRSTTVVLRKKRTVEYVPVWARPAYSIVVGCLLFFVDFMKYITRQQT